MLTRRGFLKGVGLVATGLALGISSGEKTVFDLAAKEAPVVGMVIFPQYTLGPSVYEHSYLTVGAYEAMNSYRPSIINDPRFRQPRATLLYDGTWIGSGKISWP